MNLLSPLPGATQRTVFVGKTGSGKTTLAQRIVSLYENAIVLDVKGEMTQKDWPGFVIFTDFSKLIAADNKKVRKRIYQPRFEELNQESFDRFFRWVYERKNTAVYVDEVLGICGHAREIPKYYKAILTRGRQRGVACLQATQTPMDVPHSILSQSELYYVFYTKMPQDREKIERITGIPVTDQMELNDFEFLTATDKQFSLQKRKLKL
jgi:ABC-type oligopeptide transport system ATPase subunit